jgi:hypothetical protein
MNPEYIKRYLETKLALLEKRKKKFELQLVRIDKDNKKKSNELQF